MDLKKFMLEGNPVCRKEAVIVGDHFRITMLTTALIRFEYSEDGGFEDRATQMVCNRDCLLYTSIRTKERVLEK